MGKRRLAGILDLRLPVDIKHYLLYRSNTEDKRTEQVSQRDSQHFTGWPVGGALVQSS